MKLRKITEQKEKNMAQQEGKDKIFINSVQEREYLISESVGMREQGKQKKGQKWGVKKAHPQGPGALRSS